MPTEVKLYQSSDVFSKLPNSHPISFSLNNLETIKAVTLAVCSIQSHFIRDIRIKCGISNSLKSPYKVQNSDEGTSDF